MEPNDHDDGDPVRPKLPTLFNRSSRTRQRRGAGIKRNSRKLEMRARWVVNEFIRDPTYSYLEMIDAVRERFACGITAAEQAYQRAGQIEAEMLGTLTAGKLVNLYFELLDEARAAGKFNAARAIVDSIFDKTGLSAPSKHEFSVAGGRTLQQMAHVNVLGMTPNQRAARERELSARVASAKSATNVIDVNAAGTVTEPPPDERPATREEALELLNQLAGPDDAEPDEG